MRYLTKKQFEVISKALESAKTGNFGQNQSYYQQALGDDLEIVDVQSKGSNDRCLRYGNVLLISLDND